MDRRAALYTALFKSYAMSTTAGWPLVLLLVVKGKDLSQINPRPSLACLLSLSPSAVSSGGNQCNQSNSSNSRPKVFHHFEPNGRPPVICPLPLAELRLIPHRHSAGDGDNKMTIDGVCIAVGTRCWQIAAVFGTRKFENLSLIECLPILLRYLLGGLVYCRESC